MTLRDACLPIAVWMLLAFAACCQAQSLAPGAWSAERHNANSRRVAELIEQLGAPVYITRRSAELELKRIGLPAFDQVLAATESPDPEVSAAAEYLLSEIAVEWVTADDPPVVRSVLLGYGDMDEADRLSAVDVLTARRRSVGLSVVEALCRIARFDSSPVVSRRAAGVVITSDQFVIDKEQTAAVRRATERLDREYGPSRRPASRWLSQFVEQATQPSADALAAWSALVAEETERFNRDPQRGDARALALLEWNLLRLLLAVDGNGAAETVGRMVALTAQAASPSAAEQALGLAFDWLLEVKADDVIDQVVADRETEMAGKWGRYLLATVRQRQGRADEAQRLAAAALATPHAAAIADRRGGAIDGRLLIALRLREMDYPEWANGELRQIIDDSEPLTLRAVRAQQALADSLQDNEHYQQAASILQRLAKQINSNARSKRDYNQLLESWGGGLLPSGKIEARRHYCAALGSRAEGNEEAARRSLDQAIESDPEDADVLIAMYRSPDAPAKYRSKVTRRIRELAEEFEQAIENAPGDNNPLNQWAWLIGNTQGDFEQAIAYSERSLQISPGNAGHQDTLARCYFAAGRFKEAVAMQRKAVEQLPYMRVMRRQLEEFEAAAADSNSKSED